MANTSRPVRRTALLASAAALLGLVGACGSESSTSTAPRPTQAPRTTTPDPGAATGAATTPAATAAPSDTAGSASASARTDGRCRTGELRAEVGRVDPGAGQRNFPIVLTNTSDRTCTVRGYPGAAFVDASGGQLGPDPVRAPSSPGTVTLAPGKSAWAGLSFSSPQISGARTATPAALLVTPPDEHDPIRVAWTAGEVPVGGDESSVKVTALEPGTGP
ncbi:hypothetical protein SROCM77S_00702 [Streptomyces rochei]|uniref:DUF4232 domain-containing protein n=1 Tax=Streptomyces plicatus TaxID=1922 RepID=A0ABW1Y6I7_STRPL|nr:MULTISPECIES: DUF4232 domain-containing protein [Streptomyces]MCC8451848.1 DUF4232 domain-containing protein [Streptomyces rochei]GGZ71187.1 lipoprotein [Streptomyces plicatus]